ncbi:protein TIFY 6B-like isoform X4 [Gastrolobium bilobum]|uniref:protein TIFY 6B-like isoform X4 n=1 Tax=Gastrolobium bilobum TaxID=150636 RepID=UPI002AB180AD|nr:protein TIFY 6B-like isoform X4 [Gastrolobium bilobum]
MERDFMGLSSKESLSGVKEEMNNDIDGCKDTGFTKGSVVKWPFLNKVSAHPHLMSFNVSQDDKTKMMGSDSITSAGLFAIPSLDKFDSIHKRAAGELQNMNGANVKQPLLGGIPVTAPHSVLPIVGAVAGTTESCVKPSAPAPQLTIFYAGTVNVFHDITPEKAQAIMLLAGNGLSAGSNMAQSKVQALGTKLAAGDSMPVSQPINVPPCSGLSSPLSVSSHTGAQSGSGSSCNEEFLAAKTSGGPINSVSKVETPKVVNATTMLTSAVPQARKASLARFLEKRKERVMNSAPYNLNKKSEDVAMQNTMISNIYASTGTNTLSAKQG